MSDRATPRGDADATDPPAPAMHDLAVPRSGAVYDPRPREDQARRTIAYILIGLLAVVVLGLLAMVVFGTIAIDEIKDFGVILGPLVALVSAATGFYYGTKGS